MTTSSTSDATLASLRKAADAGDPAALHRLAIALVAQHGQAEAFVLHKRAAIEGYAPAQVDLARMLLHGSGCSPDPRSAVYWLRHAEGAGDAQASCELAYIALGGVAMPRDGRINERVLAAVQGDCLQALRAVAIHFGRKPAAVDQQACVRLLDRAASHGDIIAAQLLAERLARGEGCAIQPAAAQRIWRRLSSLGVASLPAIERPSGDAVAAAPDARPIPPGTISLEDALHATPAMTLSERPLLMQIDGLLSADECRLLVACAQRDAQAAGSSGIDIHHEDLSLRLVQLRLARSARMELAQAEPLRIARMASAPVAPHADAAATVSPAHTMAHAGERIRTIRVFLDNSSEGVGFACEIGGTVIAAAPGRALICEDALTCVRQRDVSDESAPAWVATLHFRQRRYRNF